MSFEEFLAREVDTVLLDCDGVIWQGATLVPGVANTLRMLKNMGKQILFVTNNASKSRRVYAQKFALLGIECSVVSL